MSETWPVAAACRIPKMTRSLEQFRFLPGSVLCPICRDERESQHFGFWYRRQNSELTAGIAKAWHGPQSWGHLGIHHTLPIVGTLHTAWKGQQHLWTYRQGSALLTVPPGERPVTRDHLRCIPSPAGKQIPPSRVEPPLCCPPYYRTRRTVLLVVEGAQAHDFLGHSPIHTYQTMQVRTVIVVGSVSAEREREREGRKEK